LFLRNGLITIVNLELSREDILKFVRIQNLPELAGFLGKITNVDRAVRQRAE
jgi:hypothetical protein